MFAEKAVLDICGYYICLQDGGSLQNIGKAFKEISTAKWRGGGQLAADFICAISKVGLASLARVYEHENIDVLMTPTVQHGITIHKTKYGNAYDFTVTCTSRTNLSFTGCLDKFIEWAMTQDELRQFVGKDVEFKYEGGSKPGTTRRIRVSEIDRNNLGVVTILGFDHAALKLDINKPEEIKSAYRKYRLDRVTSAIKLVGIA